MARVAVGRLISAWTYTAVRGSKSHGPWSDIKHLGSCISTSNNTTVHERYGVNTEPFLYHYPPAWMQMGLLLFLFLIKIEGHKDSVIMTSLFYRSSYIIFGRERKIWKAREREQDLFCLWFRSGQFLGRKDCLGITINPHDYPEQNALIGFLSHNFSRQSLHKDIWSTTLSCMCK